MKVNCNIRVLRISRINLDSLTAQEPRFLKILIPRPCNGLWITFVHGLRRFKARISERLALRLTHGYSYFTPMG